MNWIKSISVILLKFVTLYSYYFFLIDSSFKIDETKFDISGNRWKYTYSYPYKELRNRFLIYEPLVGVTGLIHYKVYFYEVEKNENIQKLIDIGWVYQWLRVERNNTVVYVES